MTLEWGIGWLEIGRGRVTSGARVGKVRVWKVKYDQNTSKYKKVNR